MANSSDRNPILLGRRIAALEVSLRRQFALNGAAADQLLRHEEEIGKLGSYIVALVKRAGGRVEFTMDELGQLAQSDLEVHYAYPTPERPTFIMQLGARGARAGDARTEEELEAELRARGVPQEAIDAAKAEVDAAERDGAAVAGAPDPEAG